MRYSNSWTNALNEVRVYSEGSTEDTKGDKEAYKKFFDSALKKFGVSSPAELEGPKKKEFYDYVDANWKGDNEKPEPEDKQVKEEVCPECGKDPCECKEQKEGFDLEESYWKVSIPDMPPFFVEGGSASNIKMDMRTKLKPDVFKEVTVERVARGDMIKKYKEMAKGDSSEEVKEEVLLEAGGVQAVDPAKQKMTVGKGISSFTSGISKSMKDRAQKKKLVQKQKDATTKSGDAARVAGALEKDRQSDVVKKAREKRDSEKSESVDLLDTVKNLISEAKPEFEVKYSSSKKGPIKVTKFMTLGDAKEFLAQQKKEGMNGIISKGGKPVKEENIDENPLSTIMAIELEKKKKRDAEKKKKKNEDNKPKWQKTGLKNKGKELPWQKTGLKNEELEEHCGECGVEGLQEADYELYHKDFSSAMQHAYKHAKKKGFTVDPEHIDQKVALGPKKPSNGKTNRYILGTNKSKNVHIQVANLDNKKFELNMYIEDTDLGEKWSKEDQKKFNPKTPKHANRKTAKAEKDARHAELRRKAGFEEVQWWKKMVREDSITNPKITTFPNQYGTKADFGKDIKKNEPPKPKKTKTGESK